MALLDRNLPRRVWRGAPFPGFHFRCGNRRLFFREIVGDEIGNSQAEIHVDASGSSSAAALRDLFSR